MQTPRRAALAAPQRGPNARLGWSMDRVPSRQLVEGAHDPTATPAARFRVTLVNLRELHNTCRRRLTSQSGSGIPASERRSAHPRISSEGELLTGGLQVRVLPEEFRESPAIGGVFFLPGTPPAANLCPTFARVGS